MNRDWIGQQAFKTLRNGAIILIGTLLCVALFSWLSGHDPMPVLRGLLIVPIALLPMAVLYGIFWLASGGRKNRDDR